MLWKENEIISNVLISLKLSLMDLCALDWLNITIKQFRSVGVATWCFLNHNWETALPSACAPVVAFRQSNATFLPVPMFFSFFKRNSKTFADTITFCLTTVLAYAEGQNRHSRKLKCVWHIDVFCTDWTKPIQCLKTTQCFGCLKLKQYQLLFKQVIRRVLFTLSK